MTEQKSQAEQEQERKAKEADQRRAGENPPGDSGYVEPRPEQKEGGGQDLGQKQEETLREADWNKREGSEADPGRGKKAS